MPRPLEILQPSPPAAVAEDQDSVEAGRQPTKLWRLQFQNIDMKLDEMRTHFDQRHQEIEKSLARIEGKLDALALLQIKGVN